MMCSQSNAVRGAAPALRGARDPAHGSRVAQLETLDPDHMGRHQKPPLSGNVAR